MLDKEIGPGIPDFGFEDHPVIEGEGCDCDDDEDDEWDDEED